MMYDSVSPQDLLLRGKFIHIFGRQSVTEWHFTLRGQHPIGAGLVQNDSIGWSGIFPTLCHLAQSSATGDR